MKTALIALCAVLTAGAVYAQSASDWRPGLWESRTLKMTMDGQDMLPVIQAAQKQMRKSMDNLPPEQRKKMEAIANKLGDDPSVQRACWSAEMVKNDKDRTMQALRLLQGLMRADCADPKVSYNGSRVTAEIACKRGADTIVAKGETEVASELITGKMEGVITEAGVQHRIAAEIQQKFISSDCGGIKPIDIGQLAKDILPAAGK